MRIGAILCAVLFFGVASSFSVSVSAQGGSSLQQTFESCGIGKRPCGTICMDNTYSCCDMLTSAVCPPGRECCGTKCGCGKCQRCENGACVPVKNCRQKDQSKTNANADPGSSLGASGGFSGGAFIVPAAVAAGLLGAVGIIQNSDGGSHARPPISP